MKRTRLPYDVHVFAGLLAVLARVGLPSSSLAQPLPGNPQPVYPENAIRDAVLGRVELAVTIKPDGTAGAIRTVFAAPTGYDFDKVARQTVSRWKFKPIAGHPNAGVHTTAFDFQPGGPVFITQWEATPGAGLTFPESRRLLQLKRGSIRTPRWFSDYSLDVEFRILEDTTSASLLVHARPQKGGGVDGYKVRLSSGGGANAGIGEVEPVRLMFQENTRRSAAIEPKAPGEWRTAKVETVEGGLVVAIDGVQTFAATDLERLTGHIGFEVTSGVLQVRAARVERRDTYYRNTIDSSVMRPKMAGVTSPRLVQEVKPDYSLEAMRKISQGVVGLEAVVRPDGSVGAVRVTRSLDLDLDQSSVAAVRRWRFEPGTKDGQKIPVAVEIEMEFRLR